MPTSRRSASAFGRCSRARPSWWNSPEARRPPSRTPAGQATCGAASSRIVGDARPETTRRSRDESLDRCRGELPYRPGTG
jgi:hypothetical protein